MASTEWETPQDFFDELNKEFRFTLDPCATQENTKCEAFITKKSNGLFISWHKLSHSVFVNPPYDRKIGEWLKKSYEESQKGITVVCLIQGRSSDTIWWHDYVMKSNEIRYIKGRLQFTINKKPGTGSNISSVIVVFTPFCQGPPKTSSINTQGKEINEPH